MTRQFLFVAFTFAISLSIGLPVAGQDVNGDGKITFLVPINASTPAAGAHGSSWQTEVWIHNGFTNIDVMPFGCGFVLPCPAVVRAGETTQLSLIPYGPYIFHIDGQVGGVFIADNLTVSSRLFELTYHAQPAGVHIPVVREAEFFSRPARFIGIKNNTQSRVALRVFDPFRTMHGVVRIELFTKDGESIATSEMTLAYNDDELEPGFAAIYDISATFPQLAGTDRFDIEVSPVTPDLKFFWAVASVTDQDTQQVLLITAD